MYCEFSLALPLAAQTRDRENLLESVSLLPRVRSRDQWRPTYSQLSLEINSNRLSKNEL